MDSGCACPYASKQKVLAQAAQVGHSGRSENLGRLPHRGMRTIITLRFEGQPPSFASSPSSRALWGDKRSR